jgi:hypothetical protein
MKQINIISYIALALSFITLGIVVLMLPVAAPTSPGVGIGPSGVSQQELNRMIDKAVGEAMAELKVELLAGTTISTTSRATQPGDPATPMISEATAKELATVMTSHPGAAIAMDGMLRREIKSAVLEHIADKLDDVDWNEKLSTEEIKKALKRAAKSSSYNGFGPSAYERVDVSNIGGIPSQIDKILEEFEGVNHYAHNNALVRQISEMGEDAIAPLLERLKDTKDHSQWAKKSAVTEALEKLLTEEHEEIILKEFRDNGNFSTLIKKYMFPGAEKDIMNKIKYPENNYVDNNVVDAAIMMSPEKAVPLLLDYVRTGRNVAHAIRELATIQGVDLVEPLRIAAANTKNLWERSALVKLCLERGMSEGFNLAVPILHSTEIHSEHRKQQIADDIRKYTGVTGSYKDVGDWLEKNAHTLTWSSDLNMFKAVE